jgi:hypothetical protein
MVRATLFLNLAKAKIDQHKLPVAFTRAARSNHEVLILEISVEHPIIMQ